MDVRLGDLPTWLAAIFTGGAFGAGLVVLNLQRRDLRERERNRLEDVEDRRKEQARHVSVWVDNISVVGDGTFVVMGHYQNASNEPVYAMTVYVKSTWGPGPSVAQTPLKLVPPGDSGRVDVQTALYPAPARDADPDHPPILATFRDAAGLWWKRDEHGVLTHGPERPAVLAEMTPPPSE
jgi:hypothetical protein